MRTGAYGQLTPFMRGCLPGPGRTPRRFASTGETMAEVTKRLGVTETAVRMRLSYGWNEQQAITLPKGTRLRRQPKGIRLGARPGVKRSPLKVIEVKILQLLSEGYSPRQLHNAGFKVSVGALYKHIDRIRLKLDAFTTGHMIAIGLERKIIHFSSKEV